MALSSNSIIHFTSSLKTLEGILQNNFKVNLCSENIKLTDTERILKVPMVSFCDIPFSEMKNHISNYGNYALGLTKEWAQKQNLNPVLYIEKSSNLCKSLDIIYQTYIFGKNGDSHNWTDEAKSVLDIIRYLKSYQGDLSRKNKETVKGYRFSDEREWRFVPDICENFPMALPLNCFEDICNREWIEEYIQKVQAKPLSFTPNDIKYIIIQDEAEITPLIQFLNSVKGKTYSFEDVQRLATRIITIDQILTDF